MFQRCVSGACTAFLFALAATFGGCGSGGSSGGSAGSLQLTVVDPSVLFSHAPNSIRILGSGFGERRTKVTVRFMALAGTPFAGGTSSTLDVQCTVDSDQQVRGTVPPTFVTSGFDAAVAVILASGAEVSTTGGACSFLAQEVLDITPDEVIGGANPPFTITGRGFVPPLGLVQVQFRAESGAPFFGGTNDLVTTIGTVTSPTTITGLLPDSKAAFESLADVTVILESTATMTSAAPLITFKPVPTVLVFSPSVVPGGAPRAATIQGTAYTPTGGNVQVTLTAVSGTPFFGGFSSVASFPGTIAGPTLIDTIVPDLDPDSAGLAFVTVSLPGGAEVTSDLPLVQFQPGPTVTNVTPSVLETGSLDPWATVGPAVPFMVSGTNFGTPGGVVNVLFTAAVGTPFNNGTAATFNTTATILDASNMAGSFPDPLTDVAVDISVTCTFPSGAVASSAPNAALIDPAAGLDLPFFDTSAQNGSSLVTGLTDDSAVGVVLPAGMSFPIFGNTYSGGGAYVGSNGIFTWGGGITGYTPSSATLTSHGGSVIAPLWRDLNPALGGSIYWDRTSYSDRAVLTFAAVRFYGSTVTVTFQVVLFNTGRIDIIHTGGPIGTGNALIGIGPGAGAGATATTTDFTAVPYPSSGNVSATQAPFELSAAPDLGSQWLLFYPDGSGGYNFGTGSL